MLPASQNLTLYKGDTFTMSVRLLTMTTDGLAGLPVDLTGATAAAQIRPSAGSDTVLTSFQITIPTPTDGTIYLELTPEQTVTSLSGAWDLQVTFADSRVRTYVAGQISTTAEVTHA